jgi:hypothetical protein
MFALALVFEFVPVSLQAAKLNVDITIAVKSNTFFLIFCLFRFARRPKKRIASLTV